MDRQKNLIEVRCLGCGRDERLPAAHDSTRLYVCWDCIAEAEARRRRAARLAWLARNVVTETLRVGVMEEHCRASFADFDPQTAASARAIFDAPGVGLLINGPPGTGKTHLAAAIAAQGIVRGWRVAFVLVRALILRVRDTYRNGAAENEAGIVAELCAGDLLILDDLGHEGAVSEFGLGALHQIVTARNGAGRPTIVTSNLALRQIAEIYDDALASRLSALAPLVMAGPDRRLNRGYLS